MEKQYLVLLMEKTNRNGGRCSISRHAGSFSPKCSKIQENHYPFRFPYFLFRSCNVGRLTPSPEATFEMFQSFLDRIIRIGTRSSAPSCWKGSRGWRKRGGSS